MKLKLAACIAALGLAVWMLGASYPGRDGSESFLRGDGAWAPPPGGSIPAGVICMWSGTLASVPSGWALCDGAGGTPDLRDRFIKGWAAGVDPGDTGGSFSYTPAGTISAITEVINHTHTVNVTDPGHTHVQGVNSATTGPNQGYGTDSSTNTRIDSDYSTSSATTGITAGTDNPAGGVGSITPTFTGDGATIEPPYFKLAYIIKQ